MKGCAFLFFDGRLRFEGDGSSHSGFPCRIEPDDGYVPLPLFTPNPPEYCAESGRDFPLALPVLAPGSNAYTESDVNISFFNCVNGQSNEQLLLLRETANSLGVKMVPCKKAKTLYGMLYGERILQTNP